MPKWNFYEDLPLTNMLGNNTMDQVEYNEVKVSSSEQENIILHYLMRPCLLTTRAINNTMVAGTNVYQLYINPLYISYTSDLQTFDLTNLFPLPVSYISRMFQLWRGSLRFHLSIVASRFHACRLRILYIPLWDSTAISLDSGQHAINMVVDVTEETEISFSIPFMQQSDWLEVGNLTGGGVAAQQSNGNLIIQIVNPLTGGASPVTPITMQLFCSVGEDWQFSIPSLNNITQTGGISTGTVPLLKNIPNRTLIEKVGKNKDDNFEMIDFKNKMKPQMFNAQSNTGQVISDKSTLNINTQKAMSMSTLSLVDYPPMGNPAIHWNVHDQTTSPIQTFKQLLNMVSPLYVFSSQVAVPIQLSFDAPINISTTITTSNPAVIYNIMAFTMSIFRYWRGSTRFVAYITGTEDPLINRSWVQYLPNIPYVINNTTVPSDWWPLRSMSQATTYTPNVELTPIDITVPYNSIYERKFTPLPLRPNLDPGSQVLTIWPTSTNTGIVIGMAGGDDFCAGYLLPPPNCAQST